jgi:shikimate kinase
VKVSHRRSQSLNIALCGFHGCGKTSIGWELSRRMRRQFIDIPQELARRSRPLFMPVTRWGRQPTPEETEARLVLSLLDRQNLVIALGGESLDDPAVLVEAVQFSYLVYLDLPFETLFRRLEQMPAHRDEAVRLGREGLREQFELRRGHYERCDLQLTADGTPAQVAALILHCFCT